MTQASPQQPHRSAPAATLFLEHGGMTFRRNCAPASAGAQFFCARRIPATLKKPIMRVKSSFVIWRTFQPTPAAYEGLIAAGDTLPSGHVGIALVSWTRRP
jgi:hypothetical protein